MTFTRTAAALAVTLLAGCGGGGDPAAPAVDTAARPGTFVGRTLDLEAFRQELQSVACSDLRNQLFVIDNEQVLWERAGSCGDNAHELVLFGQSTKELVCTEAMTIAGLRTSCPVETARARFESLKLNLARDDLGLGAGHTVQKLVLPGARTSARLEDVLLAESRSAVTTARTEVVRSAAAFTALWVEHHATGSVVPVLPEVDFTQRMVVAIFAGTQDSGCMSVEVLSAKAGQVVYALRGQEPGQVCAQAQSAPMAMVTVPRSTEAVQVLRLVGR